MGTEKRGEGPGLCFLGGGAPVLVPEGPCARWSPRGALRLPGQHPALRASLWPGTRDSLFCPPSAYLLVSSEGGAR